MPSTYSIIESKTPSGVNTVTFSNIPQTYNDLILIASVKHNGAGSDNLLLTYNGDTGLNYFEETWYTPGAATTMQWAGPQNYIRINFGGQDYIMNKTEICQYSQTSFTKTSITRKNDYSGGYVMLRGARWNNTAAITSLTCNWQTSGYSFASGSVITLFGIAGA